MADGTGIQWTDATWNPLRARLGGHVGWSCVKVSEGCAHCYAEVVDKRLGIGAGYTVNGNASVEHFLNGKQLNEPLHWQRPRRIFVSSMTDVFGEWVTDEQIREIWKVMWSTQQHTYQVLTKRPDRAREFITRWCESSAFRLGTVGGVEQGQHAPLPNVWLGVSVENQARADERIPVLLDTPAAVRFISAEPLLEAIDLGLPNLETNGFIAESDRHDFLEVAIGRTLLDWVIVGGESGNQARPFDLAWARSLRDQCAAAGVALFLKQLGAKPFDGVEKRESILVDGQVTRPRNLYIEDSHGGLEDEWPEDLRGLRAFPMREAVHA